MPPLPGSHLFVWPIPGVLAPSGLHPGLPYPAPPGLKIRLAGAHKLIAKLGFIELFEIAHISKFAFYLLILSGIGNVGYRVGAQIIRLHIVLVFYHLTGEEGEEVDFAVAIPLRG